jgi:hypothetical protein
MAKEQPIELFMPPNMLKAKVGGSIAGIDVSALRRGEAALETLKAEFHDWVAADIAQLKIARDAFATNPDTGSRGRLHRTSLDMTGQAETFEYPLVARLAKSLCDLVANAAADIPMPLVDAHVDAIRTIFRDGIKSQNDPLGLELAAELETRVAELAQKPTTA